MNEFDGTSELIADQPTLSFENINEIDNSENELEKYQEIQTEIIQEI